MNLCLSMYSISLFASSSLSGLSLYRCQCTGLVSGSMSILNSLPKLLGGSTFGKLEEKMLAYSS